MSNPNRPLSALGSSRSEADSARIQADVSPDPGDRHKPADRKRLDQSLRKYVRRHRVRALSWHLDNLNLSMGREYWAEVRGVMDRARIARERDRILDVCESEIERLLVEPLLLVAHGTGCSVSYHLPRQRPGGDYPEIGGHICIQPQYPVWSYRLDFVLTYTCTEYDSRLNSSGVIPRERQVAIECDGHDFHQKTPAQVGRDYTRDHMLQTLEYKVFRFNGSQITNDAYGCAEKAISVLLQQPQSDRLAEAA